MSMAVAMLSRWYLCAINLWTWCPPCWLVCRSMPLMGVMSLKIRNKISRPTIGCIISLLRRLAAFQWWQDPIHYAISKVISSPRCIMASANGSRPLSARAYGQSNIAPSKKDIMPASWVLAQMSFGISLIACLVTKSSVLLKPCWVLVSMSQQIQMPRRITRISLAAMLPSRVSGMFRRFGAFI